MTATDVAYALKPWWCVKYQCGKWILTTKRLMIFKATLEITFMMYLETM